MWKTIKSAWKTKEIRKRLFYMLLALIIVRIGSEIPVPGINQAFMKQWMSAHSAATGTWAMNMLDAVTGGSFENMSIFALNITPYITSSIILELMTIVLPSLEELQENGGEQGRKKLTAITRIITLCLAGLESTAMCIGFGRQGLFTEMNPINIAVMIGSLTAGSVFLMWLGEQLTEKGLGNGISFLLVINILSRIPQNIISLFRQFVLGKKIARGILSGAIIIGIIIGLLILTIILDGAVRKIPVQNSRKMLGRHYSAGSSSDIPLKVNTAGVMPIIFTSSVLSIPQIILLLLGKQTPGGWGGKILSAINEGNWFNTSDPLSSVGIALYVVLTVFFAYFYSSITVNPSLISKNLNKSGATIPGVRPGKPTQFYLEQVLKYLIFIGVTGLMIIDLIPKALSGFFVTTFSFGGTSLLIIVSVTMETLKQTRAMIRVSHYSTFLRDDEPEKKKKRQSVKREVKKYA